ncbi:MAG: hypothetical protein R3F34_06195 [Planctomycetota bacterium]
MKPVLAALLVALLCGPLSPQSQDGGASSDEAVRPASPQPPDDAEVDAAVALAIERLLALQERYVQDPPMPRTKDADLPAWQEKERARLAKLREEDGPGVEWPYEGVYRVAVGRRAVVPPGYRVGGTAIVCEALLAAPGLEEDEARRAALLRAFEFVLATCDPENGDPLMSAGPKEGYDVRGWGHAQALQLFAPMVAAEPDEKSDAAWPGAELRARMRALVPHLVHCIAANEAPGGGWNYAQGAVSPFMTATTLLALADARDAGYAVDEELVDRAVAALLANRAENGAFEYSGPARRRVAWHASAARGCAAELALLRVGRSDVEKLHGAVVAFFDGWDELDARRAKQGTHEGPYQIAPYYFMYWAHLRGARHRDVGRRAEGRAPRRAARAPLAHARRGRHLERPRLPAQRELRHRDGRAGDRGRVVDARRLYIA